VAGATAGRFVGASQANDHAGTMRPRLLALLAFVLLAAALPACQGITDVGKFVGLVRPPRFVLPPNMPEDFQVVISVHDRVDPSIDYDVSYDRSGRVSYTVLSRAPRRQQISGDLEITENQVITLWKAVVAAKFDQIDARYPTSGDGKDKGAGIQRIFVKADGLDRTVETRFQKQAVVDTLRLQALELLPREVVTGASRVGAGDAQPREFIGDVATRLFHTPDCALLKDVPAQRRQPFATHWDALNFNFEPCRECRPVQDR
jgi:hypothetical protein